MNQNWREVAHSRSTACIGKRARGSLSVLLLTLAMLRPASGAVDVVNECYFNVTGRIERADVTAFTETDCSDDDTVIINLASTGGDVDAAMAIGRWARAHSAITMVDSIGSSDALCYSSCALVYIGGALRLNMGQIGLHRPYLAGPPRAPDEVRAAVYEMVRGVQEYVEEVGVTLEFAQIMFNTPPSEMRVFSGAEILDLVPERDPMSDELRVAHDAAWYGLTTDEYRQREAESEHQCRLVNANFADLRNCREAIRWGLSQSVYVRRIGTLWERCTQADGLTDEDRKAWKSSGGGTTEHPLEAEARQCRVAIMQGRQWPP